MIEIQTHYTAKIYRKFIWFNIKHRNLKRRVILGILWLIIAVVLLLNSGFGLTGFTIIFILVAVLIPIIIKFQVDNAVQKFQKNNPMAATGVQVFSFDDEKISIEVSGELQSGKAEISYDGFVMVCETQDSFYFYVTNLNAYLLTKSDFTQGTPEDLRQLLQTKLADKKFKIYE